MDDILFGNNNQATINRLAKRSYRANKQRNVFVTIALFLTAFMITSVFSLGCSYFETYQMQQIRAMGTTADVAITSLSEEQYEELSRSSLVSVVGVSQRLGSIDTSGMDDALLSITWIDETEWQEHRVPTISDIHGDYPQAKNEIMLPTWALRAMGIDDPQIGMNISLSYQLGTDYQYISDEFVLSGYYTDYSASRAGNRGAAYVSELFATQTGLPFDSVSTAMISFSDDSNALRSCEKLKRKISFTESQSFEIVPIAQSNSTTIVLPLAAIIVFIIISGYLLIYNILYISISRDTQFYGQLKTIGTTKRQIKRIVRSQIFRTAVIGIPSGLIVGGIVSLGLVPFAMNMMYSSDTDLGEIVSFSPIIFAGAAIFTFFTAIIGSMKPAKIAASISPVAASRYTEANTRSYRDHKSHRTKLSRMARDNIFRNPKSAFLTFASLFLGLILFLVSAGLLSSLSPDNFVNQWGESDFALTYSISEEGNLLSDEMLQQIETMQGIENLRVTYSASPWPTMDVIYDENVFGKYIDSLDGVSGLDFSNAETRKNYTDNFWSGVYGIDSRYIEELNKTLDKPIDLTAFEKGELVVLSAMTDDEGNLLIQPGQAITVVGESGEQVFTVATGFLDADFQSGRGNERGTAPDLYISKQAIEKLSGETKIFRIAFDTIDSSYDKGIMEQLQSITASSPGITILSRYEKQQEMAGYLLTSRIIAAGLSAVFLLIGIMNFINTMVVSVNTRKHEFATLESIGMTKKQIRNVLLWEGVYYWSISFLLLATLGTAIYIPIYSAFRRMVPYNPTIYLTTKGGGVPQEERQALTDEQVERLLDAIRDLPPYVFVMIGLYAGLRREEILALQWDSVYLDTDTPYLTVRRAWHTEHNRPVISDELKTKAAERNIPLPVCLAECLKAAKETSTSEYVVSNRDGEPLSYTQFKRLWQYIVTRTVKERSYYRYEDGKRVKHTVTPVLGEKAAHNGKVVYSLDFEVTPHQLRHTYITNLIHASVDPKTVQYLAGHESSKITMDIYAKVKYNRPDELVRSMNCAFASWDAAQ